MGVVGRKSPRDDLLTVAKNPFSAHFSVICVSSSRDRIRITAALFRPLTLFTNTQMAPKKAPTAAAPKAAKPAAKKAAPAAAAASHPGYEEMIKVRHR